MLTEWLKYKHMKSLRENKQLPDKKDDLELHQLKQEFQIRTEEAI